MGVPGLFPFIKDNYSGAITNFTPGDPGKSWNFDYVYLDSNPLLHEAVQFIFNLNRLRIKDDYAKLSYEDKELKVFERVFDKLIEILSIITPQKLLYIAFDGCAPRAKMNQQRERRFDSGLKRNNEEEERGVTIVDRSMITPGTEFMHHLSQFLFWKLREYIGEFKLPIKVIYDPPTSPGEGEHKIMDFIRALSNEEKENATHCMFGPDGDLLFLTLSAHLNKIHLLREDTQKNKQGYYDLVNSSKIAHGLIDTLGQRASVSSGNRTIYDVSNDFALIGFFVGNDFLPKIKMFLKLRDGLNKLIGIYTTLNKQGYTLTSNAEVNIESFSRFVFLLSRSEEKYLAWQANEIVYDDKFIDHTLLKYAIHGSKNTRGGDVTVTAVTHIKMDEYRQEYYNQAGIAGKTGEFEFESAVSKLCADYFKNLIWVYKYYVDTLPSWEESYKYHYAPLMMDLSKYLNDLRKLRSSDSRILEVTTFEKSRPSLPFEQLLSVLSPYSYKLLPKELQSMMIDESSPLNKAGFYPKIFEVDCQGKTADHQCIIKLPFVNSDILYEAYDNFEKTSPLRWHRNEISKSYTFTYIKSGFLANFKSRYGEIENCRVKVA